MQQLSELDFRTAAPSPLGRFESGVAVAQGKMIVVGGHMGPDLKCTPITAAYDPEADSWASCADAPLELSHAYAVTVDDRYIWMAGGFEGQHPGRAIDTTMCYDVVEDRWELGLPLPGKRACGASALVGRYLHYAGGIAADRHTDCPDHWVLNMDDPVRWELRAPMPQPRNHASAAAIGDSIYTIGGQFSHDVAGTIGVEMKSPDLDLVHRYDAVADRWEEVAPLPRRRSHCSSSTFTHDGKIICAGGRNNSPDAVSRYQKITPGLQFHRGVRKIKRTLNPPRTRGLDDIIGYDPERDRWFELGRLPQELMAPAAGIIGDEIIVSNGGQDGWRDAGTATYRLPIPEFTEEHMVDWDTNT